MSLHQDVLFIQMLNKLAAQVPGTKVASTLQTDMLHSWWLAESHLERLSTDHDNKVKVSHQQAASICDSELTILSAANAYGCDASLNGRSSAKPDRANI